MEKQSQQLNIKENIYMLCHELILNTFINFFQTVTGIVLTLCLQILSTIIVWVMTVAMVIGTLAATVVCWCVSYFPSQTLINPFPLIDAF